VVGIIERLRRVPIFPTTRIGSGRFPVVRDLSAKTRPSTRAISAATIVKKRCATGPLGDRRSLREGVDIITRRRPCRASDSICFYDHLEGFNRATSPALGPQHTIRATDICEWRRVRAARLGWGIEHRRLQAAAHRTEEGRVAVSAVPGPLTLAGCFTRWRVYRSRGNHRGRLFPSSTRMSDLVQAGVDSSSSTSRASLPSPINPNAVMDMVARTVAGSKGKDQSAHVLRQFSRGQSGWSSYALFAAYCASAGAAIGLEFARREMEEIELCDRFTEPME